MSKDKYTSAHISKADRVIDALDDIIPAKSPKDFDCPKCGCTEYEVRSPLGGPKIRVCLQCGYKVARGRSSITPLMPESLNHGQGTTRGPVFSSKKQVTQDKHQPTYRNKGQKK